MNYDLVRMIKRVGKTRRKSITLPVIAPRAGDARDLAVILVRIPRFWQSWAAERVLPAYEAALAQRATRDAVMRDDIDDVTGEFEEGEKASLRLVLQITPEMKRWVVRVEEWHRSRFAASVLSSSGVDLKTILGPDGETMSAFNASISSLITDIDDSTRQRIERVVFQGFQNKTPRRELARQITEQTNIERRRALRIAADQTTKMAARLDEARAEQAGIEEYIWHHSQKVHPRVVHVMRNGLKFRYDTPPPGGPPGTEINCGCKGRAWIDLS
jgi:SPP1 gp7 family putative phage head morphogenesis protein